MHLNTVQNTAIKTQQYLKIEKQSRSDPERLTAAKRLVWGATVNNCKFWLIIASEIAARTGASPKTVQRTFKIKRDQGYMVAIKLRTKTGKYHTVMYITSNVKISRSKWIESIQDIDFDKFIAICKESKNLTTDQRENLEIPKLKKPSKYTFVYDRDGILQQTTLKSVPADNEQYEEYRALNEQKLIDKEQHSPIEEITEPEPTKIEEPENTGLSSIGHFDRQAECPPNIIINTNKTTSKTKTDDDSAVAKINEKMPSDLNVYQETIEQLAELDDIPLEFSNRQLPSIIRYNRENPPRKPQDWPKWAENKIIELWDKRQDKAEKRVKRSLDNGEPIKIPKYITLPPENAALASKVYDLDRDLIINLFDKFKAYWIDKGDKYDNWLARFDDYLAAISESGGQIIPIQWS